MSCIGKIKLRCLDISNVTVQISKNSIGPWVTIHENKPIIHVRPWIIDAFCLPCRYVRITLPPHQPARICKIMNVFGMSAQRAKSILDPIDYEVLLNNPYTILFG
mmetsp:Transcript_20912/g.3384  ORF Transcript_20912/g.3384 Transcript_20912/m.3384 type:complete len:105 (+) Transcript_20912:79-393(+)